MVDWILKKLGESELQMASIFWQTQFTGPIEVGRGRLKSKKKKKRRT